MKQRIDCNLVGCKWPECNCSVPDYAFSAHNRKQYCKEVSRQDNCKYGYVLPDRCRYNSITGCDCGAYPPLTNIK